MIYKLLLALRSPLPFPKCRHPCIQQGAQRSTLETVPNRIRMEGHMFMTLSAFSQASLPFGRTARGVTTKQ